MQNQEIIKTHWKTLLTLLLTFPITIWRRRTQIPPHKDNLQPNIHTAPIQYCNFWGTRKENLQTWLRQFKFYKKLYTMLNEENITYIRRLTLNWR